jgi:hypothetical protein
MNSFTLPTIHPNTGHVEDSTWHEAFFGPHCYGVEFADGSVFPANAVKVPEKEKQDADE